MYANLHAHTIYSTQDGHALVDDYVQRAVDLGHRAVAVTDHGNMGAVPEFFKACGDRIKPIAGCEIYMVPHGRGLRGDEYRKSYHLTLLAMNQTGYKNLVKLSSRAHLEGTYYVPRADYELLNEHAEGVICLSGCIASLLAQKILTEDHPERVLQTLQEIYGEQFFLELQNHGPLLPKQTLVNTEVLQFSRKHQIPAVGTNDSHFCAAGDGKAHRYLIDAKNKGLKSSPYTYFRDNEEMLRAFGDTPLLHNSLAIAEMCEHYPLGSKRPRLPKSPLEREGETPEQTLRRLCMIGLRIRLGDIPQEYLNRFEYEMSIIKTMGNRLEVPFERYFLMIADLTRFAREHKIRYAPRGSAAGSLICWALKISELDPIQDGLLFERFLNPDRLELPDIDTDFADDRRDEIFQYLLDTYGADHVTRIGTYGAFGPKGAIRDAAKIHKDDLAAVGIKYVDFAGQLNSLIPHSQNPSEQTLKGVLAEPDSPLKQRTEIDPDAKTVIDTALQLAGRLKSTGTHAAGTIVSDVPLTDLVPLRNIAERKDKKSKDIITTQTQYEMGALENIGLIKMDVLGLSELAKTEQTVQLIKQRHGVELDLWDLPLDDKEVWKIFTSGHTLGLFQLAGANMTRAISMIGPTSISDLALVIAIFRPGPVENLDTLAARKHGREPIIPLHEACAEMLQITYGLPVYQEQVMELFRILAGYSLAEADGARKAMGKKITALMEKHEIKFKEGCLANGHSLEDAERVWEQIQPFANYGFNKSHAFAYARLGYQSAYLKRYYSQEFFTAALDTEARISRTGTTPQERLGAFTAEARHFGIEVLPPDINLSVRHFEPVGTTQIRFPLTAIKDVADDDIGRILRKRPFESLDQLITQVNPNKKSLDGLILSGSLPWGTRAQLMHHAEQLLAIRTKYKNPAPRKKETKEQALTRGALRVKEETANLVLRHDIREYDDTLLLGHDLDYLGISRTPFPELVGVPITAPIARLGDSFQPRKTVRVAGMIIGLKPFTAKISKKRMARGVVFDGSGRINLLFWESTWRDCESWLKPKMLVSLLGDLEVQREEEVNDGEPIPSSNLTLRVIRIDELALPSLSRTNDLLIPPVVPQDEARLLFATIAHIAMDYPGDTCISVRYRTQREDIWINEAGARTVASMLTALVGA